MRFLGVLLDKNLSFKWHVQIIRVKISCGLGIVWKLKRSFPFPIYSFILLYFSLIYRYVCYCSSLWMSRFPSVLVPIHHPHEKAARILQSATHNSVDLLKIKNMYVLSLSSLVYQNSWGDFFGTAQTSRGSRFVYSLKLGECDDSSYSLGQFRLRSGHDCGACLELGFRWDPVVTNAWLL